MNRRAFLQTVAAVALAPLVSPVSPPIVPVEAYCARQLLVERQEDPPRWGLGALENDQTIRHSFFAIPR